MQTLSYRIHDLITVRLNGLSPFVLPDLNTKFHFFQAADVIDPDIDVEIGKFTPDLKGACTVDQRYFVRKDYLYFYEEDKGLKWEAELCWKEDGKIAMKFYASAANRLKMPWTLFPEMVLHQYILIPLIEEILIQKGWFLLHAGAAAKDGKAVLWMGRGGTYKTSFALHSLEQGYELLGDDFVLVNGKTIYSFPTSPQMLEFTQRYLKDERLGIPEQCLLAGYLAGNPKVTIPFTRSAQISSGLILLAHDTESGQEFEGRGFREKVEMIITNQLLERSGYVSYRYRIGQFLEAYDYVFPGARGISFEKGFRDLALKAFEGIPLNIRKVRLDFAGGILENTLSP